MAPLKSNTVVSAFVKFKSATGQKGKARPVLIFKRPGEYAIGLKITTAYENKPDYLKKVYYEIQDWQAAGLRKKSWVDTAFRIDLRQMEVTQVIGALKPRDVRGLKAFYQKRQNSQEIVRPSK